MYIFCFYLTQNRPPPIAACPAHPGVVTTENHRNRAAGRGCHDADCSPWLLASVGPRGVGLISGIKSTKDVETGFPAM